MEIRVARQGGDSHVAPVHVPYMMQAVSIIDRPQAFAALKPQHQHRLSRVKAAREIAPLAVQAFLQEQFHGDDGSDRLVSAGRGDAAEIQQILQTAVDRNLVPLAARMGALRAWLKRYGIGVDCSAFVQHALTRLLRARRANCGNLPGRSDPGLGFLRSGGIYRDVAESSGQGRFAPVPTPGVARPGDILVKPGHVRLVAGKELAPAGAMIVYLVESTSATGTPCGQTKPETDIGPRRLQVMYPRPDQPIAQQLPMHRALASDPFQSDVDESLYVLGRLRALHPQ